MRRIDESGDLDVLSSEVLSVLQFCNINEPFFPNLDTLELSGATEWFLPFIPLFLSPRTTVISITFDKSDFPKPIVASMVNTFPTLCPSLEVVCLQSLPRDPMIAAAVSEMLLATNRNTLKGVNVDSPLTEEACEVIYKLPDLSGLSMVIGEDTLLTPVVLPNLTILVVSYDHGSDWLQMFDGVTFGKLEIITFHSGSKRNGDFLEEFERITRTTSTRKTLLNFAFCASHPWRPGYRSLLPFTRLKELVIEFPCESNCSSTIDDDTITDLARAMPRLEILYLGEEPCRIPIGVTAKGLAALAYHCRHLSELRIHFEVDSLELDPPEIPGVVPSGEPAIPQEDCALTELDVGKILVQEGAKPAVALCLLRIFPRIKHIKYSNRGWRGVADAIKLPK